MEDDLLTIKWINRYEIINIIAIVRIKMPKKIISLMIITQTHFPFSIASSLQL